MSNQSIADRIRELYENTGQTKKMFSESIGMSVVGFTKLINKGKAPQAETISNVLKAFPEVNKDWLLKGIGTMSNNVIHTDKQTSDWANKVLTKLEAEIAKKDEEIQWLRDLVNKLAPAGKLKPSENFSLGQGVPLKAA